MGSGSCSSFTGVVLVVHRQKMFAQTMPPRLTVAPLVHAHFVRPVRSWPSMSSDDLDDPDLEDDDPYIAFRNARGSWRGGVASV